VIFQDYKMFFSFFQTNKIIFLIFVLELYTFTKCIKNMPEIIRFYGIIIRMFFNDHAPPHFHAEIQDSEAVIDICTLEIIQGSLPKRAQMLVLEWAVEHREELM
jgi:hypothetical protein